MSASGHRDVRRLWQTHSAPITISIAGGSAQKADTAAVALKTDANQRRRAAADRTGRHQLRGTLYRSQSTGGRTRGNVLRHLGGAVGAIDDRIAGLLRFRSAGNSERSRHQQDHEGLRAFHGSATHPLIFVMTSTALFWGLSRHCSMKALVWPSTTSTLNFELPDFPSR